MGTPRAVPIDLLHADEATKEHPAIVILSQVLPDAFNLGYQDQRYQVLQKVNGRRVNTLAELREALNHPTDKYHVLDFLAGESAQRIVIAADGADRAATQRVLQRFGIGEEYLHRARKELAAGAVIKSAWQKGWSG